MSSSTSSTSSLSVSAAAAYVPAEGQPGNFFPDHWWRFDEASGTTAKDTGKGVRATATGLGSDDWTTSGLPTTVITNISAATLTSTRTITYPAELFRGQMTLTGWVRWTATNGNITLFAGGTDDNNFKVWIDSSQTFNDDKLRAGRDNAGDFATSSGTIPVSTLKHFAVRYDYGQIDLFINGVASGSGKTTGLITSASSYLTGLDISGEQFTGWIDDYRLYYRLLDDTEIAAIHGGTM